MHASDDVAQHPATVLEAIAAAQPELPALVHGDVRRSWAEFDERASRFAAVLGAASVGRFAPVGIYLRNCPEFLEAHYGALKARCVPININHRYLEDELAHVLNDSRCEAVVVHAAFASVLARVTDRVPTLKLVTIVDDASGATPHAFPSYEELLAAHGPAAPVERLSSDPTMFYTGGTTGMPRAVVSPIGMRVSEGAVRASGRAMDLPAIPSAYSPRFAHELRAEGLALRSLPLAPLMHGIGLNVLSMPTLMFGGCVVTSPARSFTPEDALGVMERESVTSTAVIGDVMAKPLLAALEAGRGATGEPWDLRPLRSIASAGMAWGHEVMRRLVRALPHVALHEIFGATEAVMGTRTVRHAGDIETSAPTFDPEPGLKLLREDGAVLPPGAGRTGLIAVPATPGKHYHGDPAKTAAVFPSIEGILHAVPGDMGTLEPDGRLRPIGRGSSVINTGGEKVFPDEVENVIRDLPEVVDCLVVGVPHPRWGEQVTAVMSVRPGADVSDAAVRTAVQGSLAGYKAPRQVIVVPEVPRHANGKGDFAEVRRLIEAAGAGPETG